MVMRLWREHGPTPVWIDEPQGAFYFFIDVHALQRPSVEIAENLLEEASVALVPGSVYGEGGEGFLRMTIAASDADIESGFRSLLDWADKRFGG
jgi:aspartate/methionine/tyrosine aminotransferase